MNGNLAALREADRTQITIKLISALFRRQGRKTDRHSALH
jgi:hypothetical protein